MRRRATTESQHATTIMNFIKDYYALPYMRPVIQSKLSRQFERHHPNTLQQHVIPAYHLKAGKSPMQSSNTAVAEFLVTAMFSYWSLFSHACHATHTRHGLSQHPAEANEMQTLTCVANQAQRCVSEPTCGLDSIKVPSACSPAAAAADLVRST